jgi:uncharacterized membrane protein YhfC
MLEPDKALKKQHTSHSEEWLVTARHWHSLTPAAYQQRGHCLLEALLCGVAAVLQLRIIALTHARQLLLHLAHTGESVSGR